MTSTHNLPGRLLILLVVLAASLFLLGGTGAAIEPAMTMEHRVRSGDTLWAIATDLATPGEDVRDLVADLKQLNELDSSELHPGQIVLVPIR
jgi:LysM repeat protein